MTVRKPTVNGDRDTWGDILNTFLDSIISQLAVIVAWLQEVDDRLSPPIPIEIENLSAGSDISARTIYGSQNAFSLRYVSILTRGVPVGVDDSNTVVITIRNGAGEMVVSKTYNTFNQPPSNGFESLGALGIASFDAGDHLTLYVTCNGIANMPAFSIVLE